MFCGGKMGVASWLRKKITQISDWSKSRKYLGSWGDEGQRLNGTLTWLKSGKTRQIFFKDSKIQEVGNEKRPYPAHSRKKNFGYRTSHFDAKTNEPLGIRTKTWVETGSENKVNAIYSESTGQQYDENYTALKVSRSKIQVISKEDNVPTVSILIKENIKQKEKKLKVRFNV